MRWVWIRSSFLVFTRNRLSCLCYLYSDLRHKSYPDGIDTPDSIGLSFRRVRKLFDAKSFRYQDFSWLSKKCSWRQSQRHILRLRGVCWYLSKLLLSAWNLPTWRFHQPQQFCKVCIWPGISWCRPAFWYQRCSFWARSHHQNICPFALPI